MTEGRWITVLDGDEPADRDVIGGKAWSLWRMYALGVRVPPAFVITIPACRAFFAAGEQLPAGLDEELTAAIGVLERRVGRRLGHDERPLLLSVRSGAPVSMPGMMDTVLNLGMTDAVEDALARETGSPAFAADTHRRFRELYGRIVLGSQSVGQEVPADPRAQLNEAITAVFRSSNSRRARTYRAHYGLPDDLGTAVTVQAMVFGNLDDRSGTGVLFSRNPLDGSKEPYGEYLPRGQGEDVVSGKRTPQALWVLDETLPEVHAELLAWAQHLELEERDVQDIEFTVQSGTLYLLQARAAKRSAAAAVQIAADLVDEGILSVDEALAKLTPEHARTILRPTLADGAEDGHELLAAGTSACHGVAVGLAVTDPDEAVRRRESGEDVVLVRATTSPDDMHGMMAARAIVTGRGGTTSHAAVVGRALGTPCVVGAGDDVPERLRGRTVTVDGDSGRVFDGRLPLRTVDERSDPCLSRVAEWARARTSVRVIPCSAFSTESVLDLDALERGHEIERLPGLLSGADVVAGAVMGTDDGIRAAVAAGVKAIVASSELTALLAIMAAERETPAAGPAPVEESV